MAAVDGRRVTDPAPFAGDALVIVMDGRPAVVMWDDLDAVAQDVPGAVALADEVEGLPFDEAEHLAVQRGGMAHRCRAEDVPRVLERLRARWAMAQP